MIKIVPYKLDFMRVFSDKGKFIRSKNDTSTLYLEAVTAVGAAGDFVETDIEIPTEPLVDMYYD